ncbi:MAG: hypothetical protein HFG91_05690 [Acholeplasmatales bacterium]|jgi:hypothetical protein|nr:hypothetical protein [Acholeplasmatales bacterium]
MNFNKITYFLQKAHELQEELRSKKAYEDQMNQSQITKKKMDAYYCLQEKMIDLYQKGYKKIPELQSVDSQDFSRVEVLTNALNEKIKNTEKYQLYSKYLKEIPELVKAGKFEQELEEKFFDYALSQLKLDAAINDTKNKLFSKEYLKKMDEYAEEGILLYFLETPDFPILDEKITKEDLLEVLLFDECSAIKVLFQTFVTLPNPSPSMEKKIDDVIVSINNLNEGYYRSAARNIFALLESEHKNIAKSLEGFFAQEKKYKNGKQRSTKIDELVKLSNMPRAKESWEKFDKYYERIVTSTDSAIDRNAIIHGDYYSNKLDITAYDVVKLLLLYLSFRSLGDYIQNHVHIFEQAFQYMVIHTVQAELEKGEQNE